MYKAQEIFLCVKMALLVDIAILHYRFEFFIYNFGSLILFVNEYMQITFSILSYPIKALNRGSWEGIGK